MNQHEDTRIDEIMNNTLNEAVPPEVENRLRTQLQGFREQLSHKTVAKKNPKESRRVSWIGISTIAATIVGALLWLGGGQGDAWAEVVEAIGPMRWMRFSAVENANQRIWVSPGRGILAVQNEGQIRFADRQQRVSFDYDAVSGQLERKPFDELLSGGSPIASAIMGSITTRQKRVFMADSPIVKLVKQQQTNVEGGVEYVLDFVLLNAIDVRAEYLVETSTNQPVLCSITSQGITSKYEVSIEDYGPASVYEMGVPKDAPLIDHVPTEEIAALVEANRIGRNRVEPYSGLIVSHADALPWYFAQELLRVWRVDGKWRIDKAFYIDVDNLRFDIEEGRTEAPSDDVDHEVWWREQAKNFRWVPIVVSDGTQEFRAKVRYLPEDIDGREAMKTATFEVTAFEPPAKNVIRNPNDQSPSISLLPEQYGYPLRGRRQKLKVAELADGDPSGTVLLVGENMKVWLDPTQQYMAKQYQLGNTVRRIVDTKQSPGGYLYPSKIEAGSGTTEYYLKFKPAFPKDVFTTKFAE